MTKDQIIAMAREAGFRSGNISMSDGDSLPFVAPVSATSCIVELERFAQLVAAHEREQCAIEASSWKRSKLLLHAGELTAQERRSCEAVSTGIAAAIRARRGTP